jgi:hypothetical protein
MSFFPPVLLLAGFSHLEALAPSAEAQAASYQIQVIASDELRLRVDAVVRSIERITISDYGAWSQPRGWAAFIEDLRWSSESNPIVTCCVDVACARSVTEDCGSTPALRRLRPRGQHLSAVESAVTAA